ncbi:MAG: T9SS type A sorting domain-containing protein [Bacteroidales bacterium]|nr:T9SS type A sorting domain-containing protein [Bacteroidales bacterium]
MNRKIVLLFIGLLFNQIVTGQQYINRYEFWFNDDVDSKISQSVAPNSTLHLTDSFNVSSLYDGMHLFNIRFRDNNNIWSSLASTFLIKLPSNITVVNRNITACRYWFNTDYQSVVTQPANGMPDYLFLDSIQLAGLYDGVNVFNIQYNDDAGLWSSIASTFFVKQNTHFTLQPRNIISFEYFFNSHIQNKTTIAASGLPGYFVLDSIPVSSLNVGLNTITYRFKDDAGLWSSPVTGYFIKESDNNIGQVGTITQYEYWFNNAYQNRIPINVPAGSHLYINDSVDVSSLNKSVNTFNIRFFDDINGWNSVTSTMVLIHDDPPPIKQKKIIGYRYWLGDDTSTIKHFSLTNHLPNLHHLDSTDLRLVNSGTYIMHFQFLDSSGVWSSPIADTVIKHSYPYVTFSGQPGFVCPGQSVTFQFDTADVDILIWNYGDGGSIDTTFSPQHQYNQPGTFDITVTAIHSDSNLAETFVEYAHISVGHISDTTYTTTICYGDSFLFDGIYYNNSGNFQHSYTGSNGCDSIIRLNLTIMPLITTSIMADICQGQSYTLGSQTLTQTGNYTEIFTAQNGCDSVVNLSLTAHPIFNIIDTVYACQGDTINFGTINITSAGNYQHIFTSHEGCDSTVDLTVVMNPSYLHYDTVTICQGDIYNFGNQTLTTAGTYIEPFNTVNGCDSVVTLLLDVKIIDTSVTLNNFILTAQPGYDAYQWLDCNNNYGVISGEISNTFSPVQDGVYAVEVTSHPCVDTSICYSVIGIGISELINGEAIFVYPNPFEESLLVTIPDNLRNGICQIIDINGSVRKHFGIDNEKHFQLNLGNISSGIYLLRIRAGAAEATIKVIKL